MIEAIRLKVEGKFNSFRIPFFRTYHSSYLAPPKTTIVGMIANIGDFGEKWFYNALDRNIFDVSVVLNEMKGFIIDLWAYKTIDEKNRGKSIVHRIRLFSPSYYIFLKLNDDKIINLNNLYNILRFPKKIPALGQDDEMIKILSVDKVKLKEIKAKKIDSFFAEDFIKKQNVKWQSTIQKKNRITISPYVNLQPTSFNINYSVGSRSIRQPARFKRVVEWLNCDVNFNKRVKCYSDGKYSILFY